MTDLPELSAAVPLFPVIGEKYHMLMRRFVDKAKLAALMNRLAAESSSPGHVYFTGGATTLLLGLRNQTIDVDIKLDPEPRGPAVDASELRRKVTEFLGTPSA